MKIKEKIEELKKIFKETKNSKIHMLILKKTRPELSNEEVSSILVLPTRTFYKWQKKYNDGGLKKLLYDGRVNNGKTAAISGKVLKNLEKEVRNPNSPFTSYIQIQKWLKETQNIDIKYKALHKFMTKKLKTKLKVARPSHIKKKGRI